MVYFYVAYNTGFTLIKKGLRQINLLWSFWHDNSRFTLIKKGLRQIILRSQFLRSTQVYLD